MAANTTHFFYPARYRLSKLFGVKADVARVPVASALRGKLFSEIP